MSQVTTTRKMSVLTLALKLESEVTFGSMTDDNEIDGDRPLVRFSRETWEELGEPEALTIAIYPGDRQDLMEQEDFPA